MADEDKGVLQSTTYAVLGGYDADIMALAFLVMMEAAKSAQEDLKSIMEKLKLENASKAQRRKRICASEQELAAAAASLIASHMRPVAILAAPEYSQNAARELSRWIQFVVKTSKDD
jgi:hypothetical protein